MIGRKERVVGLEAMLLFDSDGEQADYDAL
jgi:hypothetical protein